MFFIFNPQVVPHVVMLVSLRGQRVNDSLYIFTLSIKINKKNTYNSRAKNTTVEPRLSRLGGTRANSPDNRESG